MMDNELTIAKHNAKHNIRIKVNTNNNMKFVCSIEARASINQLRDKLLKVYEEISQANRKESKKLKIGKLELDGFILPREEIVGDLLADYDEINCEIIAKSDHHQEKKQTYHEHKQANPTKKEKNSNQQKSKKQEKHEKKQEKTQKSESKVREQKSKHHEKSSTDLKKSGQKSEPNNHKKKKNKNKNKSEERPPMTQQQMNDKKEKLKLMFKLHKSDNNQGSDSKKKEK